ncbi:MAG TPA: pyroglutamyl-peptidase I [Roseiflexaceae bacterium]|nr:pyroglutamyl-peptidase I [Roseiflexaceae bacterium]
MSCVLLTGFEPFAERPLNVSAAAVAYLREQLPADIDLHCALLPVTADQAPQHITAALREIRPDVCLMLGQADGISTLAVERVAVNLCDFRIADNGGWQLRDAPVVEGGPTAYFATVPTRAMVEAAQTSGAPAALSLSAGAFICNMVFYTALHCCAQQRLPTRCGFVHLPLLPIQVAGERPTPPSMALETIGSGLRAMIELFRS